MVNICITFSEASMDTIFPTIIFVKANHEYANVKYGIRPSVFSENWIEPMTAADLMAPGEVQQVYKPKQETHSPVQPSEIKWLLSLGVVAYL